MPLEPTVFLIDDDTSFLTSVARLLRVSGFHVKAFVSATEFLEFCPADAAGCVIADLQMPGMSGIELQEALAATRNPLPIIFLTGHGDIPTSVSAMRHGAEDFLTKRAPQAELLAAVQRALARNGLERRQRSRLRELRDRFDRLTPRDNEVLAYLFRGALNKQIAADLHIDERSVKRHRANLMTKLQVQSIAELIQLAHEGGIVANPAWTTRDAPPPVQNPGTRPRP